VDSTTPSSPIVGLSIADKGVTGANGGLFNTTYGIAVNVGTQLEVDNTNQLNVVPLPSGLVAVDTLGWSIPLGSTFYVAQILNGDITATNAISATLQIGSGVTGASLVDALTTCYTAWLMCSEAGTGTLNIYLEAYPNATNSPLNPADPNVYISWAVTQ
jgi:hypothetical protein